MAVPGEVSTRTVVRLAAAASALLLAATASLLVREPTTTSLRWGPSASVTSGR